MKDIGNLAYFLGLEIQAGTHGIFLSQHKYAINLVAAAGLQDLPPLDTPMEINVQFRKDARELLPNQTVYQTGLISLMQSNKLINSWSTPGTFIWLLLKGLLGM